MKKDFPCDIIRDLLPGYIDGILSEAGTALVKEHLDMCEECMQMYSDMKEDMRIDPDSAEPAVLDGFKKLKQYTKKLKITAGIISGVSIFLFALIFFKFFIIGELLPSYAVNINNFSYEEDNGTLKLSGSILLDSDHISRVTWEADKDDSSIIYLFVYASKTLPFQTDQPDFTIDIPDIQGKTVFLANQGYQEIYDWEEAHYEQVAVMKQEIYDHFPELDRNTVTLDYIRGIHSIDGVKGICFSARSDDEDDTGLEIWISLEQPYQLSLYDHSTGKAIER